MVAVPCWTGAETKALRQAMRLSIRAFAAHLGIDARTVNKWEARGGTITLRPSTQSLMDTALNRAPEEVKTRFTQTAGSAKQEQRGDTVQLAAPGHGFRTEPAPDTDSLALSPGDDGADSLFTELARHLLAHAAATSTGTTGPFPDQETHARQLADYLRTWATDVNRRKLLRLLLGIGGGYSFAMGTVAAAAATPGLDSFDVKPSSPTFVDGFTRTPATTTRQRTGLVAPLNGHTCAMIKMLSRSFWLAGASWLATWEIQPKQSMRLRLP